MKLEELVDSVMGELAQLASSGAIVGQPLVLGSCHMVPLCRVTVGFGTGQSEGRRQRERGRAGLEGGAAGGAISVEPKAFVVVGQDGSAHLLVQQKGGSALVRQAVEVRELAGGAAERGAEPGGEPKRPGPPGAPKDP